MTKYWSPAVVEIFLIVVVTVVLVVIGSSFAFDIGDDKTSLPTDVIAKCEQDNNQLTSSILRHRNVEVVRVEELNRAIERWKVVCFLFLWVCLSVESPSNERFCNVTARTRWDFIPAVF